MRYQFWGLSPVLLACGVATFPLATGAAGSSFRVLHSGCRLAGCPDGAASAGGVIIESDGSLFGSGDGGKNGRGVLFRLTANAHGQDRDYARLHTFCGGTCRDGGNPDFSLVRDASGNVYGTAAEGGADGGGTIFAASPEGKLIVLHAFCAGSCKTGSVPSSGLTYQGAAFGEAYDGVSPLYGTTGQGGLLNGGTVYAFARQDGKAHVRALYSFCSTLPCNEGAAPLGGLTVDAAGNIFGIANLGGAQGEGAVFELSSNGTKYKYRVLYNFCSQQSCTDGIRPAAGLTLDSGANLYGTTTRSGEHDEGTIFQLSPNGASYTFQVLYQFVGQGDGGAPEATMAIDPAGNLFGTAVQGGGAGAGVAFELSPGNGGWSETVLHSFCAEPACVDGSIPYSPLTLDGEGHLFGSTAAGGATNAGVVYQIAR